PGHASRRQLHAAFRDGVWVEALNPKTALFFLAFLPQFIDPAAGSVWLQFVVLGAVSVALNTLGDVCVVAGAGWIRQAFVDRPALRTRLQQASGSVLVSLGVSIAATGRT
ncbi:MAG: LysE family translocator, partial [Pseudomonadota bacterium]